jgi:hypothetical protein
MGSWPTPSDKAANATSWEYFYMKESTMKSILFQQTEPISKAKLKILVDGHISQEMEDKWVWYFANGTIHVFRSWTGHEIYRVSLQLLPSGEAMVQTIQACRDPDWTSNVHDYEDISWVRELLDLPILPND